MNEELARSFRLAEERLVQGDLPAALQQLDAVLHRARSLGDEGFEAAALQRRGVVKDHLGDSAGAEADVRAALTINLRREGPDGEIVRQDLFTLGVVLAGRGDSAAAEGPFLESARIAELHDPDAHFRAVNNVIIGRLQRGDNDGALQLLWNYRVRRDGPRTLVEVLCAPILVELLAERGQHDVLMQLLVECTNAQGYWMAKTELGRISERTMSAVLQAGIDTSIAIARAFVDVGRTAEAGETFDALERMLAGGPLVDDVRALRQQMLGSA